MPKITFQIYLAFSEQVAFAICQVSDVFHCGRASLLLNMLKRPEVEIPPSSPEPEPKPKPNKANKKGADKKGAAKGELVLIDFFTLSKLSSWLYTNGYCMSLEKAF